METEADLMQRREMNYTVGEAVFVYKCVCVCMYAHYRDSELKIVVLEVFICYD